MKLLVILLSIFGLSLLVGGDLNDINKLKIVFVYTVVPAVCPQGLPGYIQNSLEQSIASQSDCDVIMVSNYKDCPEINQNVAKIHGLYKIDSTEIASYRTQLFHNHSKELFYTDYSNELWITSALRFLILEDVMRHYKFREIMHVEADNLLYGKLTTILPILRSSYPNLAATPLLANQAFITASVLWIGHYDALYKFNNYLLDLGSNNQSQFDNYLLWLRRYGCCVKGGYKPDAEGNGIKPFAVNEMSMLAYYHKVNPLDLQLLPVLPTYDNYNRNKYMCNLTSFTPIGHEIPRPTGDGIWDSNSWGQYLGGTSRKKGKDKGFIDSTHIIGQAIISSECSISMRCNNLTCLTQPYTRCGYEMNYVPLWNLHVHSKHTNDYRSVPCVCNHQAK